MFPGAFVDVVGTADAGVEDRLPLGLQRRAAEMYDRVAAFGGGYRFFHVCEIEHRLFFMRLQIRYGFAVGETQLVGQRRQPHAKS